MNNNNNETHDPILHAPSLRSSKPSYPYQLEATEPSAAQSPSSTCSNTTGDPRGSSNRTKERVDKNYIPSDILAEHRPIERRYQSCRTAHVAPTERRRAHRVHVSSSNLDAILLVTQRRAIEKLDKVRKRRRFYTWGTESSSDVVSLPWLSTEACWDEEDDERKKSVQALKNR